MNLRFEDYRFVGFQQPRELFAKQTAGCEIHQDRWPGVTQHSNVLFIPYQWRQAEGGRRVPVLGGLFDQNGEPLVEAEHWRGADRVAQIRPSPTPSDLPVIEEEVVYGGIYYQHFGHFILEGLSRLWYVVLEKPPGRILFHDLPGFPRQTHAQEIFVALGLVGQRLLCPRRPVLLRSVGIPEQAYVIRSRAYSAHKRGCEAILEALLREDIGESEQPLYLSRSALGNRDRLIVNEVRLEDVLRRNGFRIFHPEQHSMGEQLAAIHRHRHVFGFWGSAFRGILFSPRPKLICQIMEAFPNNNTLMDLSLSASTAWFVHAAVPANHLPVTAQGKATLWLELDGLLEFLRWEGFITDTHVVHGSGLEDRAEWMRRGVYVSAYDFARRESEEELMGLDARLRDGNADASQWSAYRLGIVEARIGRREYEAAETELRLALQLDERQPRTHALLRDLLSRQRRIEEALPHARRAAELEHEAAEHHHALGILLSRRESADAAEAAFRSALRCDPAHARALARLAALLQRGGRLVEAAENARMAAASQPYDVDLLCEVAEILAGCGQQDEAVAMLRAAIGLDADCFRAHLELGRVLRFAGDLAGAMAAARRAGEIDPGRHEAFALLGELLMESDEPDAARAALEKASSLKRERKNAAARLPAIAVRRSAP